MSSVLRRYLGRELLQYWLVFTLVLWLVLVAARFSLYLGQAAAGRLPADTVLRGVRRSCIRPLPCRYCW